MLSQTHARFTPDSSESKHYQELGVQAEPRINQNPGASTLLLAALKAVTPPSHLKPLSSLPLFCHTGVPSGSPFFGVGTPILGGPVFRRFCVSSGGSLALRGSSRRGERRRGRRRRRRPEAVRQHGSRIRPRTTERGSLIQLLFEVSCHLR